MEEQVFMVKYSSGRYMRSGRNGTIATFDTKGSAQAQVTRMEEGTVVKITTVEEV